MKQKGSGSARQGRNRSPTRMGGPKAHGRRKKMHRIALPYPIRHKGNIMNLMKLYLQHSLLDLQKEDLE